MYLENLKLIDFKNYENVDVKFSDKINCLVGINGTGKTNLLDAIHYLSLCKSYFNSVDSQNILHGASFFIIQGLFKNDSDASNLYCAVKKNQKKHFKRNNKEYSRLADHIGLYPLVIITPSDIALITEASELRRKYIDTFIAQLNKEYLNNLINYNKVLLQRNALLRKTAHTKYNDKLSFEVWNKQLIDYAEKIFEERKKIIHELIPVFQECYGNLAQNGETPRLKYSSQLENGKFGDLLAAAFERDKILQRTTVGTHKDDLILEVNNFPVKRFGSQGQQKSYVIALKLAQFIYISQKKNIKPILLLDDIFDKLDNIRVNRLMNIITSEAFGQIFITDSYFDRLKTIFVNINKEIKLFNIEKGKII